MIKYIIFDLDGVLLDCKDIHYEALNEALEKIAPDCVISYEEHLSTYDGLPTKKKLSLLSLKKNLPLSLHKFISSKKQELTQYKLKKTIKYNSELYDTLHTLKYKHNIKLICASNSVSDTVDLVLNKLQIRHFFDVILSNEDVVLPKPHPEIYMRAMVMTTASPKETLIIEDSSVGRQAAYDSGAYVLGVKNNSEVTYQNIINKVIEIESRDKVNKWEDKQLNVLIPMAGAGSRFTDAGYTFPKPLIEINGKPMIQVVVENLNIDANYIFIVQQEHYEKYNLYNVLNLIAPGCTIIKTQGLTEGAACTTLLAKEYINNENPLVIANSDQYVNWNSSEFLYRMNNSSIGGGILTFQSTHPKWSYARVNEMGYVVETAEKKPISTNATVGIYYFQKGSLYVQAAEQMIEKDIRTNGEFYVCPVFNEIIEMGHKVIKHEVASMWGLGTPEDLETFNNREKK